MEIPLDCEVSGVFGLNDDDDESDPRFTRVIQKRLRVLEDKHLTLLLHFQIGQPPMSSNFLFEEIKSLIKAKIPQDFKVLSIF